MAQSWSEIKMLQTCHKFTASKLPACLYGISESIIRFDETNESAELREILTEMIKKNFGSWFP